MTTTFDPTHYPITGGPDIWQLIQHIFRLQGNKEGMLIYSEAFSSVHDAQDAYTGIAWGYGFSKLNGTKLQVESVERGVKCVHSKGCSRYDFSLTGHVTLRRGLASAPVALRYCPYCRFGHLQLKGEIVYDPL